MCDLLKASDIYARVLSIPGCDVYRYDWKQPVQRYKLREGLLTINKININSVKHVQRQ